MENFPKELTATIAQSAWEGSRHSARPSASIGSYGPRTPFPTVHFCAACSSSSSSGSPQNQIPQRPPRRLPIPPGRISSSPSTSTPRLSPSPSFSPPSSGLTLPIPQHAHNRVRPLRPLPEMPISASGHLETPKHTARVVEGPSPPTSPADAVTSLVLPQRPTDIEELHRGNLSKLQYHMGKSVPPDVVPPRRDSDEAPGCTSGDEEERCLAELTEAISPTLEKTADEEHEKLIRRHSCRWLRGGGVEEDYDEAMCRA
ncbi:hypothetical protein BC826DRAFT_1015590 [Russula brevipes]|nr:hypothetical protein BC826DRAFT_1015590 [Russula brevipes]